MNRRAFLGALSGSLLAAPLAAEAQPTRLPRIGQLNNGHSTTASPQLDALRRGLRELGWIEGQTVAIESRWAEGRPERLPDLATELVQAKVEVIVVSGTPGCDRLIELAARYRLPAMYEFKNYVQDGGLMSYGPSIDAMWHRAASYVDRILKGANPGDLPIERPAKFELAINLKTAKALGLTIPRSLLLQADHVIE
jgi:ABC-type uncharacterized transport system substrate-binding protein